MSIGGLSRDTGAAARQARVASLATETLKWAASAFSPRLAFATGFGREGCVILHMIAAEKLAVSVFTLDTGLLFPETYDFWRLLERTYGLRIEPVAPGRSVAQQAQDEGDRLWEKAPDLCCELRKVRPLRHHLEGFDAWITAIRANQTAERSEARHVERDERFRLVKINPLLSWTEDDVTDYIENHSIPVNPLHGRGYRSIGCWPCTTPVADGEDPRAGRWRGLAKRECGLHKKPTSDQIERTHEHA